MLGIARARIFDASFTDMHNARVTIAMRASAAATRAVSTGSQTGDNGVVACLRGAQ
jgi:hypothetical protein